MSVSLWSFVATQTLFHDVSHTVASNILFFIQIGWMDDTAGHGTISWPETACPPNSVAHTTDYSVGYFI